MRRNTVEMHLGDGQVHQQSVIALKNPEKWLYLIYLPLKSN